MKLLFRQDSTRQLMEKYLPETAQRRRAQNEDEFSKDELAMVYQYAAGTKEETLAGLKEIVPVIRDRQTREIVESTIRKLDAIPEPECRRFIADTKQRFIQKRDNSIRRRLAEAKHRRGRKTTSQEKRARPGTVIIASRAAARGLPL